MGNQGDVQMSEALIADAGRAEVVRALLNAAVSARHALAFERQRAAGRVSSARDFSMLAINALEEIDGALRACNPSEDGGDDLPESKEVFKQKPVAWRDWVNGGWKYSDQQPQGPLSNESQAQALYPEPFPSVIPHGCRLVPVEMTRVMLDAVLRVSEKHALAALEGFGPSSNEAGLDSAARDFWRAILDAAPDIAALHGVVEASSPAQGEPEPNMRHPRIQRILGARARLSYEMSLVEQLLESGPDSYLTSMDMEYWSTIHDKLRDALLRQNSDLYPTLTEMVAEAINEFISAKLSQSEVEAASEFIAHRCTGFVRGHNDGYLVSQNVMAYLKGVYEFLESTSPAGFAAEAFRVPVSAGPSQKALFAAITGHECSSGTGYPGADWGDQSANCAAVSGGGSVNITKPFWPKHKPHASLHDVVMDGARRDLTDEQIIAESCGLADPKMIALYRLAAQE